VWYMIQNLCCAVTIDSVLENSKTQNVFLSPFCAMFCHDCPLVVKPAIMPRRLLPKQTWTDSLPVDMLLSAISVLVVAQPSSEVPEGLTNYSVFTGVMMSPMCLCKVCLQGSGLEHSTKGNLKWRKFVHRLCTGSKEINT
jgi:hypothetical protein